jgi:uncharacterized protein with PQ loop repeat
MMAINDLPLVAGSASMVIFVISYMPMLVKAVRTKDLSSYSPMQLVLTNFGNVLYSAYVFSLPLGPIWALHSFYLVATALMLAWYVRYTRGAERPVVKLDGSRWILRHQVLSAQRGTSAGTGRQAALHGLLREGRFVFGMLVSRGRLELPTN